MDKYKYLKKGDLITLNPYSNELYIALEVHGNLVIAIPKEGGQEIILRGEIYKIDPVKTKYEIKEKE